MAEDGDDIPEAKAIADHKDNADFGAGVWVFVDICDSDSLGKLIFTYWLIVKIIVSLVLSKERKKCQ